MKIDRFQAALTAVPTLLVALAWGPSIVTASQTAPVTTAGTPAPRLPSGKPDLSGVWMPPYVPDMTKSGRGQQGQAELPFTPTGLKDWTTYDAVNGDYTGSCLPFGLTRSFNAPYPFQIMQSDTQIAVLFEIMTWHHVISLNPPGATVAEPTWFGHSTGQWDGDTLVVHTTGFNGYTRLDTVGHPHSDALHVTQTFRRTDAEHMAYTVTIDDPKTYTRPWKNQRTITLLKGPLIEYSCEENNKSLWDGHFK